MARRRLPEVDLPLREEFESSGNWLFRWRSYLPLVLFVPVLLGLRGFTYPDGNPLMDRLWELICLGVSLIGLAIRVATVGHAPANTSGRNTAEGQVAGVLNSTGFYSVVRHPLYVGNYFMWLGVAMYPRTWWVPVFVSLAFWLYYERIMFAEEEFLRRKFGEVYERWASATPAFIPRFRQWRDASLPFCARTVLKREYSGIFGLVASFTAVDLVGEYMVQGRPTVDGLWRWLFATTLVLYVVLILLKRRTRVLKVAGR